MAASPITDRVRWRRGRSVRRAPKPTVVRTMISIGMKANRFRQKMICDRGVPAAVSHFTPADTAARPITAASLRPMPSST